MASKALMVLGFLLVALLFITSEVAARELAEKAMEAETKEPVNDAKYGGYPGGGYHGGGGGYPGGGGGYPGGGYHGGGGYPGHGGGGYPGHGGGGYPGHGGGGYPGHGGGGYPGRGCRYGCCGHGYYGGGCRCCTHEGEVPDFKAEAKPHN